jgi:UPF0755 protein
MRPLEDMLHDFFDWGHHLLDEMAARWQPHANRRTLIVLVIAGALCAYLYVAAIQPPDNFPLNTLVSVDSGEPLSAIAASLQAQQVVRSPLMLRVLVTLMGAQRSVHAGDYLFKEPLNVFSVARALAIGRFGLEPVRIRVPEGATVKQMAVIFDHSLLRFDADNFVAKAQSQEGYLFPDTYNFLPNATESMVIDALRQNFDDKIAPLHSAIASSTHSLADIVTMASILEREAFNTQDRRMIAGVLWNRLARGMPLQVDATFAYTLGKGTFQLTMKDLTTPSPYNTYVNKGLPPTPIGSPSLDSLEAALTPIKSNYLYFLADKNGVTHYCATYACQLANKARYF